MNNIQIKKMVWDCLSAVPTAKVTNDHMIQMKCFLCGDSHKNPNKKRLGIKIDMKNPDEPILYKCFNCNRSGVFTPSMLKSLDIVDKDVNSGLYSMNKKILHDDGTKRFNKYKNNKEIAIEFPPLYKKESTIKKIKYLFGRVGTEIPIEDFQKLKLVFDLADFLTVNKIDPINNMTDLITSDYVGFLSVNNEYIIFRDITGNNKLRYFKYNIFNVFDNTNSFYAIKNSIDLLTPDDVHISIAEGPFDILGLYCNVFHRDIKNNICIAASNSSFREPLNYYIKKGLVGSNIYIDCYQDNDTIINFSKLRNEYKVYVGGPSNFNVYYNLLSKDFGVPANEILIDKLKII